MHGRSDRGCLALLTQCRGFVALLAYLTNQITNQFVNSCFCNCRYTSRTTTSQKANLLQKRQRSVNSIFPGYFDVGVLLYFYQPRNLEPQRHTQCSHQHEFSYFDVGVVLFFYQPRNLCNFQGCFVGVLLFFYQSQNLCSRH